MIKKARGIVTMLLIGVLVLTGVWCPVVVDAEETVFETTEASVATEDIINETEMTEVAADVPETEAVREMPEDSIVVRHVDSEDGIQTYALGTYGVNHGMFWLYSSTIVVPELGPNGSNPCSHIIQLDTNGDGDYSDVTYTAYCIQYGVPSPGGNYLTESALTVTQRKYIGYALAYGWRQSGTAYDEDQYSNLTNKCEYTVTQGIIWCCSRGKFNTSEGESAMTQIINASCDPTHARTYYNSLKATILSCETKPSFDGQTLTLVWNSSKGRYEATLTDTNGILSNYNYAYSGINFSNSGNTLTVWTTNTYASPVTASASRTIYGGENSVVCWDGWSDTQDMATYTAYSQSIQSTLKIQTKTRTGYAKLKKASAKPDITNGNACYSLAGAVYGVYSDAACKTLVGKLTTDANGDTNTLELAIGTYHVKELTAPKGYALDKNVYDIQVRDGQTYTLSVKDTPQNDPVLVLLKKVNSETGTESTSGGARLKDAQFTVKYYAGLWNKGVDPATLGKTPERTWVIKTNKNGQTALTDSLKISGDDFYYGPTGKITLPIGTVTIQETKAPEGYLLNEEVFVRQITSDGYMEEVDTYNVPIIPEQVIRGNFSFTKNSEDGFPLSGVKFKITSKTTGENHVVTSDRTGKVTTSDIWFGAGEKDNSQGSLPYDTYIVEELRCDANFYYQLVEPFEVTIDKDNVTKDLGIVVDYYFPQPEIETVATGKDTGTHDVTAQPDVTIIDTVSYKHLVVGRDYTFKGILMDKSTGEPLLVEDEQVTAEMTLTASEADGSIELNYIFDATGFDVDVVVFERLYDEKGKLVASHTDIEDIEQTVKLLKPDLGSKAADELDGDNAVYEDDEVTIIDTVSYTNLTVGQAYTMRGILMDKSTGEAYLSNGGEVTSELEFIPEETDGSVDMTFTLDASEIGGSTLVVFETLYHADKAIASHEDIEDTDQTMEVLEPSAGTTASNAADESKEICAAGDVTIVDTVSYTNLIPGKEYTVKGILMDKSTGEPFKIDGEEITSEIKFTPEETNGSVDVEFTFNAVGLKETTLVVFETLYIGEREVAAHTDLDDVEQSIEVLEPDITTTASNASDESKEICAAGDVTIVDTVSYTNLILGKEYTVKGILMDKSTGEPFKIDGEEITSEVTFTPEETNGSVDVEFTFDAVGLKETTLVVFETLYHEKQEVTAHTDIEDTDQSIEVLEPTLTTSARSKADGKKQLTSEGSVTITDTVAYKNLVPENEYTLKGVLMDKSTGEPLLVDKQPVASELVFTPEAADGSVDMTFILDATGLGDKTVVAYETLYRGEQAVAAHEDIDDAGQTVVFKAPPEKPKTGDTSKIWLCLVVGVVSLIYAVVRGGKIIEYIKARDKDE